ncbi:uncharacterized protein N7487_007062 [Penicillium crustosum]|uniref:uncharacterized protein n=1 Tax=Penicillium crustosum TaxID=36656 RepID=UPI0023A19D48|nr:uncharacterized protein N7487_007062 [Penicillium crustosum]KAJ5412703.1 hypothetical protein N7487_007062 [Penicillium crustosum]
MKQIREILGEEEGRIGLAQHVVPPKQNARVSDHVNDAVGNVQTNVFTPNLHSPLGCAEST